MYLHLGQNVIVPEKEVVGIFDLDNTTGSHITRALLAQAEKERRIVNISEDLPKSFVICQSDGKITIYLSQLSSATLARRSGMSLFKPGEGSTHVRTN